MKIAILDADFYASKSYAVHAEFEVNGRKTGVPFGTMFTLGRIIKEPIDELLVCWGDHRKNLWRKKVHEPYKAHRSSRTDFYPQVVDTQNIFNSLGIKQFLVPEWEADDIIGHFCKHEPKYRDCQIDIYSNDHDMLQLCSDRIKVVREKGKGKTELWGPEEVENKYKTAPSSLPVLFAYMGEKGDGIAGIPGIGPVKASQILDGTLEMPGKDWATKMENMKLIRHNQSLIRLDNKVPMENNTMDEPEIDWDYIEQIAGTLRFGKGWISAASKIKAWSETRRAVT